MKTRVDRLVLAAGVLLLLTVQPVLAQAAAAEQSAALSGKVTGPAQSAVAGATVSLKQAGIGQPMEAQTDAAGVYSFAGIAPGDYEISVVARGFESKSTQVNITAGAKQNVDVTLEASGQQGEPAANAPTPAAPQPNAPAPEQKEQKEPTLQDLGFPNAASQSNAKEQALLDRRTHMLKIHQRLGLITTIPLAAAVISGAGAGGRSTSSTTRDLHAALGSTAAGFYIATAYFAIRAPRIAGTETRGPIKWHKALAWVHGPGMILTPILGAIAFNQKSRGEKVHGIASAHLPVALVTAGAFGAALVSVSVKF